MTRKRTPAAERARAYYQKTTKEECWPWTGAKDSKGYGRILNDDQRVTAATRVVWAGENGPIPGGMNLLHRCDNPKCVNPDHLFVGTLKDNSQDCKRKGRHRYILSGHPPPHYRGSKNPHAKMSEATVASYRHRLATKQVSLRGLARETGLDVKTLANMRDRVTWRHVD